MTLHLAAPIIARECQTCYYEDAHEISSLLDLLPETESHYAIMKQSPTML